MPKAVQLQTCKVIPAFSNVFEAVSEMPQVRGEDERSLGGPYEYMIDSLVALRVQFKD